MRAEAPAAPEEIEDLNGFAEALNNHALLPVGHTERARYRKALLGYLVRHLDNALDEGDNAEALTALQYVAGLYAPSELREVASEPQLQAAAHHLYRVAAKRGSEEPVFLTLAIEQHFGSKAQRARALQNWRDLEDWIVRNGPFASAPLLRHEELEHALEGVAATFPSPFVTKRLADLYRARYDAAERAVGAADPQIGTSAIRRREITAYLMLRLYLRADDLRGALNATADIEVDLPTRKLRELVQQAFERHRTAGPLLTLAQQFLPGDSDSLPAAFSNQGWGIVANLAGRAVRQHPNDPYAHLLMGQAFVQEGLTEAAIHHLEMVLKHRKDVFEAWRQLAALHQQSLARLAHNDLEAASERLKKVESFHREAAEQWQDRPVQPGLPQAYVIVAEGLYDAGRADEAEAMLMKSIAVEAQPDAVALLGTIALKRRRLDEARTRFQQLAHLSYRDPAEQLRWEAHAWRHLGEIAGREGNASQSAEHWRMALRHINRLLALPPRTLDPDQRAAQLVERGKLLFAFDNADLGLNDFRAAAQLAPANAQTYADPLLFLVSHGHYGAAHTIYRLAVARPELGESLKLYFSLWMLELAQRQGHGPDPDVVEFLRSYHGDKWEEQLALHAQGKLSFDQLFQRANNVGERAEAYFYEALRLWRTGNAVAAKALLNKVLKTNMVSFFEYDMAQSYLEWGELPRSARPPLTGDGKAQLGRPVPD